MGRFLPGFVFVLVLAGVSAIEDYTGDHEFDGCDQVIRLALNESIAFTTFPPRTHTHAYGLYATALGRRGRGPQECTWLFETRDRDCQLEFHQRVSVYSRGDVDCEQQYFLFGDENREERFCGFRKPPLQLNSTGSRLFMTHFQQNGRGYAHPRAVPRVGGVVKCEPLIPKCSRVLPACGPSEPPQFLREEEESTPFACGSGPENCVWNGSIIVDNMPTNTRTTVCSATASQLCQLALFMYFAFQPLTSGCAHEIPPLPFIPPQVNCTTMQATCPCDNPNCLVTYTFDIGGTVIAPPSTPCAQPSAPPGSICTLIVAFCLTF